MRLVLLPFLVLPASAVDFSKEVYPVLQRACFECHGAEVQKGDLRLDTASPKHAEIGQEVLRRVQLPREDKEAMPKRGERLKPEQITALKAWIDNGAKWPEKIENLTHWSYIPPVRPKVPAGAKNPVDGFIREKLTANGLQPAPPAAPETLIRRLSLDLTGLPPSPSELTEKNYEALVDKLLASKQFGVRWARPWLDLARYADSHGFQRDDLRDIWAYRDWVVDALNANMPFDQFTLEQIAGDLLPNAKPSQIIATGFHRCTPTNVEAGTEPEESRINQVIDRVNTTGAVWLGTTLECAQCHNHKYDPITQKDFYSLLAYYNNTEKEAERANPKTPGSIAFNGSPFALPDADRAAVCTWMGDVWTVSGLTQQPLGELKWHRIASGLVQPLGLKIINGSIFVCCRDQLAKLHDLNADGETDFIECFNSDHQVTEHFHEFAMGLQSDAAGNFYYAKSARHALKEVVAHHGTLLRVSADGTHTDILATGFRAANGVCLNPDGTFFVTDQEGHWTPKNRINLVRGTGPDEFYGNMFGYHNVTDSSNTAMQQPLCWITNAFDRSPSELVWVPKDAKWGPLNGSLLNLSYGYGKIYTVPFEKSGSQPQGGMCALPMPQFPTGVMRGRFHPTDGQFYACGMFAWAGNQSQPGGFYRVRWTGKPALQPIGLHFAKGSVKLDFSDTLDATSAADLSRYEVRAWDLKRSANYGSEHIGESALPVTAATLRDGKSLTLTVPTLHPAMGVSVTCRLRGADGKDTERVLHGTIHQLGEP